MKKEEILNVKIFGELIQLAITRLEDGYTRFFDTVHSEFSLTGACLRDIKGPRFMTEQGERPRNNEDVQKDFYEEIDLIVKLIDECKIPIKFKYTSANRRLLSKRNIALQVWKWYAIPWRFKNRNVYIIWAPWDLLSAPTIEEWPIDYFLTTMADISESQVAAQIKIEKQLKFWKDFGSWFIVIMPVIMFLLLCFC